MPRKHHNNDHLQATAVPSGHQTRHVRSAAYLGLLLALLVIGAPAKAQTATQISDWSFSGYGTLGHSQVVGDAPYAFVRDLSQKPPTTTGAGSWLTDSRLGMQAAYRFSPQTDAVLQAVVRSKDDATVENSIEWAYVSHRPTENLNLRVGRVGIDVFMLSDYRSLGYAQTMVRPNWDFYGYMRVYSLDGLDATYTHSTDVARWNFKAQAGRTKAAVPIFSGDSYDFVGDHFFDITAVREAGPWRIKAGYAQMTTANEAPLSALTGPLSQLGSLAIPGVSVQAADLAHQLSLKDARITYLALGASYDDGTWLMQGEISRVTGDRLVLTQGTSGYLQVGRRFGTLTPYVGFSGFHASHAAASSQSDWATLLGEPSAAQLQAGAIWAVNSARVDQNTLSVGLRWDIHPQVALKVQWDNISVKPSGFGLWTPANNASLAAERINLVTTSLDWVF